MTRPEHCRHSTASRPGVAAVARALALAEDRCLAARERWTEPRRRTYELLVEAGQPMKAYDLVAAFSSRPATAKPATIYRALEFLAGLGLVHRVECLNAFVACADTTRPHNAAFLICDCCGAAEEHDLGAYAEAKAAADLRGFRLDSVLLEARGRCRDCAQDIDNLRHRA